MPILMLTHMSTHMSTRMSTRMDMHVNAHVRDDVAVYGLGVGDDVRVVVVLSPKQT